MLLNVLSNARYALNQRHPLPDIDKRIVFAATRKQLDQGDYVRIKVTDYGTGIEHDLMDRIMDPFFSTKAKGEGTGLGLSISHSLVKENRGYFSLRSQWGEWTTAIIDLPTIAANKE